MTTPAQPVEGRPGAEPARADGARGEQTRRLVVDTAVRLFREHGYDKTTMRAIAREAGLSVGNAYYYFGSKEHLMQEFYARVQDEHAAAAAPALARTTDLTERLHATMRAGVDVMTPYHGFAGKFFKFAADPDSPLSPFSPESAEARERSLDLFRTLVSGATTKIDPELRADLPELLWLAHLGITLYWVHDRSPGQSRTRLLVDRAVPLIGRLVGLARVPVLRSVVREALGLYRALRD
jgi:AcrR family transcriptional regulator